MLKYLKRYKSPDAEWQEISKNDALITLLGSYKNNSMTREMLDHTNEIPCAYSDIKVVEE